MKCGIMYGIAGIIMACGGCHGEASIRENETPYLLSMTSALATQDSQELDLTRQGLYNVGLALGEYLKTKITKNTCILDLSGMVYTDWANI